MPTIKSSTLSDTIKAMQFLYASMIRAEDISDEVMDELRHTIDELMEIERTAEHDKEWHDKKRKELESINQWS